MAALDFSGKEQLYYQLYDILFQDIVNNVYAVGDLIPSESELMRHYGVSRATARKAMEMLSNNGLIKKRRGHGSEVISNHPNTSPQRVESYIKKSMTDRVTPEKRLVDACLMPAGDDVAQALDITPDTSTYCLRRVRYSGDMPFYLETIHAEESYLPGALDRDFSKESWRGFLINECKIHWSRVGQRIFAVAASADVAEQLHVEPGSPTLYIHRVSYDQQNKPRELVQTYYRADLYHLEIELGA